MGDTNANCPQIFKNTAQNSPKHAISSEKDIFFLGKGLDRTPLLALANAFQIHLRVPQIYVCAFLD